MDQVAISDTSLLAAAAGRPRVTVFADDAYPTFKARPQRFSTRWSATMPRCRGPRVCMVRRLRA